MCFHLASCARFVFCHFPSRIESAGHIWGMRGQSCARRHHLGLETVCHSGPSPSPSQTPRYCRLRHGNMGIHIPAACPKVFLRSVACSLVHGYLAFRWPVGFPCLGLWCGRGVCASVCVLFCVLLDLLLRFFGFSHFLRFLLAVYVLFAGSPRVLLARLLQPLPLWSCGVFVSAWHAYVVWRASVVCICYMSLYRAAPDVFFSKVKSVLASDGFCKRSMSSFRVVGKLCTHAPYFEFAATVPCWSLFLQDVFHRDHKPLFLCMSSTLCKMRSSVFGASLGTARAPASSNTQSIAKAGHSRHGEQRILCIFFCHRCVSIGLRYIHFCVSGPSTPHTVFLPSTLPAMLPNQYLLLAKVSKVESFPNACLADMALGRRAVGWPGCFGR